MKGERGNFKSRVFGGFNRHDVIDYIETLAGERNALAQENERLRGKIDALTERLEEALAPEPEQDEQTSEPEPEADGLSRARDALAQARGVLSDVKREYDAVCTDIKINATQTDRELNQISLRLRGLRDSLAAAGERLEALGAGLHEEAEENDRAEHI